MKKTLILTTSIAVLLGAAVASFADWGSANPKPNTVKVGIFRPSEGAIRESTESVWFNVGYERIVAEFSESNSDITLEAAWTEHSGDVDTRIIPLLVNWRTHFNNTDSMPGSLYAGLGAGVYLTKYSASEADEDKTKFGLAPAIGYAWNDWSIEAKYHFIGSVQGKKMDGLSATVGFRF